MFSSPLTPSCPPLLHANDAKPNGGHTGKFRAAKTAGPAAQSNWIRRGAWAAFGLATLPGVQARHTAKHTHHGLQPRSDAGNANAYSRPWLTADAKVVGVEPWQPTSQRRSPGNLDRRQQYDTSGVDWAAIDWSKVNFAETDWSAIDYSNTQSLAVTYTYTVQAAASTTAQPSLLQANQFGGGNNIAAGTAPAVAAQVINAPLTTFMTQATPLIQVGNVVAAQPATSAGVTTAPAPAAVQTMPPVAAAAPVVKTQIGAGPNSISIRNYGSQNLFAFFANAGQYQPTFGDAYAQFRLASGQSETVLLPANWSGRVQKVSGQVADPATWAEFTFNGYLDLTFFDVSYIRGYNGPVVMQAADGSAQSGSSANFFDTASSDLETTDSSGNTVLQPTEPYTGGTNYGVVSFLRSMLSDRQAYVQNFDNGASIATADHDLVITFS